MCDRDNLGRWDADGHDWSVSRRAFVGAAALGAIAACAPMAAGESGSATGLREETVRITTPDGVLDAFYVAPASGRHPAVLTWPDIAGLRDAFKVMARRLAAQGHAVLVANPYYRSGPAPQFADFAAFLATDGFAKATEFRKPLTPDAIGRDAAAAIGWLNRRAEVDRAKGVGTNGYCMGGPFTVYTAAAVPDRVRAAASLHGGGLFKADDPQSPHALLARTRASYLFAIGQNDDAKEPNVKTVLDQAAVAAGRPVKVQVYAADHGWTVLDSPSYDRAEAERAWGQMSELFKAAL